MRQLGERLVRSPGYPWVLGWIAALIYRGGVDHAGASAWISALLLFFFTFAVLAVLTRLIVRWSRSSWIKRLLAGAIVLMIAAFIVQRVISPGDTWEIEQVIENVATSDDPSFCYEDVTEAYLHQMTGAQAPFADELCASYALTSGSDSVEVSQIEIDGDRAIAIVAPDGGSFDGSPLSKELVEEQGDWRLNRITGFAKFNREKFDHAYRESFLEFGSPPSAADCAVGEERRFSDAEIKRMVLDGDPGPFTRIVVKCDRPGVERNLVEGFQEPPYDRFPSRSIDCVEARIKSVSDAELARLNDDLVAYGAVLFDCDQEAVFDYLERELREEDDLDSGAVECVLERFRGLPHAEIVRLTYDQEEYEELIEDCKS